MESSRVEEKEEQVVQEKEVDYSHTHRPKEERGSWVLFTRLLPAPFGNWNEWALPLQSTVQYNGGIDCVVFPLIVCALFSSPPPPPVHHTYRKKERKKSKMAVDDDDDDVVPVLLLFFLSIFFFFFFSVQHVPLFSLCVTPPLSQYDATSSSSIIISSLYTRAHSLTRSRWWWWWWFIPFSL